MTADAPEIPLPGLRTKAGFFAAVSSEVRNAFLKIKDTIPPEPVVKIYKPPPLILTPEPIIRRSIKNSEVRNSLGKPRQPNSYELITRHLLEALQKEAKLNLTQTSSNPATAIQPRDERTSRKQPLLAVGQSVGAPSVRASSPLKRHRRLTERRRTLHGRATKDRHYFYKKHHLPTPPFVNRLAAKYRVDAVVGDENISESPEPVRGLSIVTPPAEKPRGFIRTVDQTNNPYVTIQSPSLSETGKFVKNSRQLQRVTLPMLGPNRIQTEAIHLRDKSFRAPVLNFELRAMAQRFKAARNNPEYLAGIRVECGQEWQLTDKSKIFGTLLPYPDSQILATCRRDRKMQVNKKSDIVERARDLNRKETRLSLRKRKIQQTQRRLDNLDVDMQIMAEKSERNAIEYEAQLRRSDQQTIVAVHDANDFKAEREIAERLFEDVQAQNNLLYCHNVRREEKIKLIDRFISLVYETVPDDIKEPILDRRKQERLQRRLKQQERSTVEENPAPIKLMTEILACHKTLSEESTECFPSDDEDINANGDTIPPLLFDDPGDLFPYLDELHRKSTDVCFKMGQLRFESRGIRTKVGIEGEFAAETNKKIQLDSDRVEEEIRVLEDEIEIIRRDNDRYETKEFRRDHMRRPINILRNHIFKYYRRNFATPEDSIKKMLTRMQASVTEIMDKFQDIPLPFLHQCYASAEAAPDLDYHIEVVKRDEHDMKMQRYYYKSLDPPEIIWGRPTTPSRKVAEFIAAHQLHDFTNTVPSEDFDAMVVPDTDTWLSSRIRQMTEIEFEGVPSLIRDLQLEDEAKDFESEHHDEVFHHEQPGTVAHRHEPIHSSSFLGPSEALVVEGILSDLKAAQEEKTSGTNLQSSATALPQPASKAEVDSGKIKLPEKQESAANLKQKKQKSYPDLTKNDLDRDQRISLFLANYETMMHGGAPEAETKPVTPPAPDSINNNTTVDDSHPEEDQSSSDKRASVSRDSDQSEKGQRALFYGSP